MTARIDAKTTAGTTEATEVEEAGVLPKAIDVRCEVAGQGTVPV
jgi:hypothetical protein